MRLALLRLMLGLAFSISRKIVRHPLYAFYDGEDF